MQHMLQTDRQMQHKSSSVSSAATSCSEAFAFAFAYLPHAAKWWSGSFFSRYAHTNVSLFVTTKRAQGEIN